MNKIVCDLCGTTYSDTANQCPICGTARNAEIPGVTTQSEENIGTSSYTHVKGGRFSKKNVQKRTEITTDNVYRDAEVERPRRTAAAARQPESEKKSVQTRKAEHVVSEKATRSEPVKKQNQKQDKVSVGLTIVAIVLVVAIIAVLGYIVVRFFLPTDFFGGNSDAPVVTDPPATTEPLPELIGCESIALNSSAVTLTQLGESQKLETTLTPVDTTDTLRFESSDEAVATVSQDGTVTAIGEGSAIITAYCGSASTQCTVTCAFAPEFTLELNRKEISFEIADQMWTLYDGELDPAEITWTTDNEAVATVSKGIVTAVAEGDATITATYKDQSVQCLIHCDFKEPEPLETTPPVVNCKLVNGYGGSNKDVTMSKGSSFPLKLVDDNGKTIEDAVWSVGNKNVCTYSNGMVKAKGAGMTKVTATYNDNSYTCVVRVSG